MVSAAKKVQETVAWEVITEEWMIRADNEKQGMIGREGTVIRRKKWKTETYLKINIEGPHRVLPGVQKRGRQA